MLAEMQFTEQEVNRAFRDVAPGFVYDGDTPAMTTPTIVHTPQVVAWVVQGSTICLVC